MLRFDPIFQQEVANRNQNDTSKLLDERKGMLDNGKTRMLDNLTLELRD